MRQRRAGGEKKLERMLEYHCPMRLGSFSSPSITLDRSLAEISTRGGANNPAALGITHTRRLSVTKSFPVLYSHGKRVERAHTPDHVSSSSANSLSSIVLNVIKKSPGICRLSSAVNRTTRSAVVKKTMSLRVLL